MESITELISRKENMFLQVYTAPYALDAVFDFVGLSTTTMSINDLDDLKEGLRQKFIKMLFEDEQFLELNVVNHFHTKDDTHIFGLELIDVHDPCECCGDVVSIWYALKISADDLSLDYIKCHDCDSVEDSLYRGEPLSEVKELIINRYPDLLD